MNFEYTSIARKQHAISFVIETNGLTKRYRPDVVAVNGLDIRVKRGEVYGFVGPNGAGKTTTLRILVGLVRPTSGSCEILGGKPGSPDTLSRVGALIETPAFYPYLSGRDNLRVLSRLAGIDFSRIEPVLEEVELAGRADDRFKTYSLGMKQRLGIAAAMLKDPELLILDEPTNGLDPAGMVEMRQLIRQLGHGDRTVLISSHLMGELEQICDRIGIVKDGRLIKEGTLEELRHGARLRIKASPVDRARDLIGALEGVGEVQTVEGDVLLVEVGLSRSAEINRLLVDDGIEVSELCAAQDSLESAFLSLTEEAGFGK